MRAVCRFDEWQKLGMKSLAFVVIVVAGDYFCVLNRSIQLKFVPHLANLPPLHS
jgi:hypothetical protein